VLQCLFVLKVITESLINFEISIEILPPESALVIRQIECILQC
jgi:hypothetical protein